MSGSADDLLKFIDSSPTPYHVVQTSAELLKDAGFQYVSNSDVWLIFTKNLPATVAKHLPHPFVVGQVIGSNLITLKWFLLLLYQVRDINSQSRGNALAHKQAQLITMHSQDYSDKGRAIKGLFVCWMFLNLISLGVRVSHVISRG